MIELTSYRTSILIWFERYCIHSNFTASIIKKSIAFVCLCLPFKTIHALIFKWSPFYSKDFSDDRGFLPVLYNFSLQTLSILILATLYICKISRCTQNLLRFIITRLVKFHLFFILFILWIQKS